MKIHRISNTETLSYCHDCHNRARIEVSFAHRVPIRLCDRCGGLLAENVSGVIKGNGKKIKLPLEG
jgi:hypothetical protein